MIEWGDTEREESRSLCSHELRPPSLDGANEIQNYEVSVRSWLFSAPLPVLQCETSAQNYSSTKILQKEFRFGSGWRDCATS